MSRTEHRSQRGTQGEATEHRGALQVRPLFHDMSGTDVSRVRPLFDDMHRQHVMCNVHSNCRARQMYQIDATTHEISATAIALRKYDNQL